MSVNGVLVFLFRGLPPTGVVCSPRCGSVCGILVFRRYRLSASPSAMILSPRCGYGVCIFFVVKCVWCGRIIPILRAYHRDDFMGAFGWVVRALQWGVLCGYATNAVGVPRLQPWVKSIGDTHGTRNGTDPHGICASHVWNRRAVARLQPRVITHGIGGDSRDRW